MLGPVCDVARSLFGPITSASRAGATGIAGEREHSGQIGLVWRIRYGSRPEMGRLIDPGSDVVYGVNRAVIGHVVRGSY